MRRTIIKATSIICILTLFVTSFPNFVYATDNKFIALNISGYNSNNEENITKNNAFYVVNNTVCAPVKILEEYTMYDYDSVNNAFVRIGQEYKRATSKIVLDYDNQQVTVFYSQLHKETYDINIYSVAGTYFLPLSQMAAYLKSSVIYKDQKTISIVSSGISLCDVLYDYSVYDTSLDYLRVLDDLFVGDEDLYYQYTVISYIKSTIFSGKVSKLVSSWGNYETCCSIIENAVTNTDVYDSINDENKTLATLGELHSTLNDNVYKKANKIYKLSTNSIITMFEDFKKVNSFGDESPYDNFFPEEQLEIDKIKQLNDKVKYVNHFVEYTEYLHKFYALNDDNRQALKIISELKGNDTAGKAFNKCYAKYGADIATGVVSQAVEQLLEQGVEELLKKSAKSLFSSINKVKLATEIVSVVFKLAGFDLKDNSSYDVLLAYDVVTYITCNSDIIQSEILQTINDSEELRLSLIITILSQIEGFKIGNKIAKQLNKNDQNHYQTDIEKLSKRLCLLYSASVSEKYDSVEGIHLIAEQNKNQLAKLNLKDNIIDENITEETTEETAIKDELTELIYNFPKYGMNTGDTTISIEIIDFDKDQSPEVLYCSHYGATGIPVLEKIYVFDGEKYVEGKIESDNSGFEFPVLPMKKSGNTTFTSKLNSSAELASYNEPPSFSSFWHYHSSYVYGFDFSDQTLTISDLKDYTDFRDRICNGVPGETDYYNAWNEYKSAVEEYESEYISDVEYPYSIVYVIATGYISEDLSTEEKLEEYHKTMTKDAAEFIVQQYYDNVCEYSFSDYFN